MPFYLESQILYRNLSTHRLARRLYTTPGLRLARSTYSEAFRTGRKYFRMLGFEQP
jgi:hypothetical protein